MKLTRPRRISIVAILMLLSATLFFNLYSARGSDSLAQRKSQRRLPGWRTNVTKRTIDMRELKAGGPGKDGIPAIHRPRFVEPKRAAGWVRPKEPVISLAINGQAKAYPLQILMWHEIVTDVVGGVPVAVTFCPLCYSADVFDRRVDDKVLTFGVSGFLRHRNMVMYDKETESLWQQGAGQAIVGEFAGTELKRLPGQIISFRQFRTAYPEGLVLSRRTGHNRRYGENPYVGYDNVSQHPGTYNRQNPHGLLPRERLVTLSINGREKAYPYFVTRRQGAINDEVGGTPLVVFHTDGAVSALDRRRIAASRQIGSTGVFDRRLDDRTFTFQYEAGTLIDKETSSTWDITGRALAGPLKGKQLTPIPHGDYFAFSWLVFKPDTEVHRPSHDQVSHPAISGPGG